VSASLIHAQGLCAGYGAVPAIVDVDLDVRQGEVIALLGANGAGKTTTLLTLGGVLRPTAGRARMFDRDDRRSIAQRAREGLAVLPEQRAVFRTLTVRENLMLGRGELGVALELFPELRERLDVRAGLLSGGEQQMLALGRILAGRPKLVLADELSLGLAPLIVRRLLEALRNAAANGAGVLLVEQHVHTALNWSDRAYVMQRGRVALAGDSGELLSRADDVIGLYL
jgi:branched-chain amino acid transport system ATP-binding protein